MKKRKNFKSTKSLPYGFKMKRRQKYPRNVLFSYRASKNTPNKTKKIAHNYSYKNFSYSISYGANFSKSLFWGTQFNKVTCRYCQFNNAKFFAVTFINCNFRGCKFKGALFQNCLFEHCKFSKSSFLYAKFNHTFFVGNRPQKIKCKNLPNEIDVEEVKFLRDLSPKGLKIFLTKENIIRLRQEYSTAEIADGVNLMRCKRIEVKDLSYLFKFINLAHNQKINRYCSDVIKP